MRSDSRIRTAIEPTIEDMGFRLVRAQVTGTVRPVLQVMAEPKDGSGMSVEHCADLSRALSAVLDVSDPVTGAYTLEVSSPGIDRPLVRPEDFVRYAGFDARIDLNAAVDGQRRYKGVLGGLDEDGDVLLSEGETQRKLPLAAIRRAKLVLTDALLAAHAEAAGVTTAGDED
jgi:ribosome maturation factor RimP